MCNCTLVCRRDLKSNGYVDNILNTKIAAPSDVDYSDDELAIFAYYGYIYATANLSASGSDVVTSDDAAAGLVSLARTRTIITQKTVRSALWNSLFVVLGLPPDPVDTADVLWNLRTWPMELVDWPTKNVSV